MGGVDIVPSYPIRVVDYDPNWPIIFADLSRVVSGSLGELALAIEHVGSTSVPGLAAKPIIDFDVVVESRRAVSKAIKRIAPLGYFHSGDLGVSGREALDTVVMKKCHAMAREESGRITIYICVRTIARSWLDTWRFETI